MCEKIWSEHQQILMILPYVYDLFIEYNATFQFE